MRLLSWIIPWEPSVVVGLAAVATVFAYVRGVQRVSCPLWQKMFFALGVAAVYIVSHTHYDYYAEHEFFIHRLQHAVLHHIGPILIVLSRPGGVLWAGMPAPVQRYAKAVSAWPPLRMTWRFLMNPIVVTAGFVGLIYFWLIPPVHFMGMLDWRLYRAMNWGMLVNGLMFWSVTLGPVRAGSLSAGGRIAMMLAVIPPQIIAGAVIFYAGHELYPIYTICGRAFDGISAMADQQIGGLILWIFGSMMSVIGVLIIVWQHMNLSLRHRAASRLFS